MCFLWNWEKVKETKQQCKWTYSDVIEECQLPSLQTLGAGVQGQVI